MKLVKNILKKIREDNISEYSAECAYFTILSFVPFLIFLITIIQYINIDKSLIIELTQSIFQSSTESLILEIINEVYSKSFNTASISVIVAIWSASKGFFSLAKGLKKVYKMPELKSNLIIRLEGILYTILFGLGIILTLIFIVFGNRIYNFILQKFFYLGIIATIIFKIRILALIFILFFGFSLIYKFIPENKTTIKSQICGAFFSSVSWVIVSFLFSIYVNIFKGFSNIYGSLASIILIMIWIYVCIYIVFLGAEINMFLSKEEKLIKIFLKKLKKLFTK